MTEMMRLTLLVLVLITTSSAQGLHPQDDSAAVTLSQPAAAQANQNAPYWYPVEQPGVPIDFYVYAYPYVSTSTCTTPYSNCEARSQTRYGVPPYIFSFVSQSAGVGPETYLGGCAIVQNDRGDGVYYFDASTGASLEGQYPYPPPSIFSISPAYYNAKGMTVQGYTAGNAQGSPAGTYALAVAYVTSTRCSDGGIEYGFYRDLTSGDQALNFYYSNYSNCGPECKAGNSPGAPPLWQITSPITAITKISGGLNYFYSMYIIPASASSTVPVSPSGYVFRIQVLKENTGFATCQIDNSAPMNCITDIPIASWWPVTRMIAGSSYLVAGTQTSTVPPKFQWLSLGNGLWSYGPVWQVSNLWLGF
jgi:hypothetical protein